MLLQIPINGDWSPGWLDDATRKGELKDTDNWEKEWGANGIKVSR